MNAISTYFKTLFLQAKADKTFACLLVFILTFLLSRSTNNIALALFVFSAIVLGKFSLPKNLWFWLPVLLYALMCFSFFWTIDKTLTGNAIPREIPLLLLPVTFVFYHKFNEEKKKTTLDFYAKSMLIFALFFLIQAIIRYFLTSDIRVFFYHGSDTENYGLVPKLLNAIHVSVFTTIAYFIVLAKPVKDNFDNISLGVWLVFIALLSSTNVILMFVFLHLVYFLFYSKSGHKMRLRNLVILILIVLFAFSFGTIKRRLQAEFQLNTNKTIDHNVIDEVPKSVHYVSIKEAWTEKVFNENDFFPGTAFRVYQLRIFLELLREDGVFWQGYGLNASYPKIEKKSIAHNVYRGDESTEGYQKMNFHNQYIQNFAELGVFGFILLLIMLIVNVKNALKSKDFIHFAFAFLMISLFLTESFLLRQRGVVFFAVMYCLLNSGIGQKNPKVE